MVERDGDKVSQTARSSASSCSAAACVPLVIGIDANAVASRANAGQSAAARSFRGPSCM